jgi:hypothetical protein
MTWIPHWKQAPLDWLAARVVDWCRKKWHRRNGKRLASAEDLEALRRRFAK